MKKVHHQWVQRDSLNVLRLWNYAFKEMRKINRLLHNLDNQLTHTVACKHRWSLPFDLSWASADSLFVQCYIHLSMPLAQRFLALLCAIKQPCDGSHAIAAIGPTIHRHWLRKWRWQCGDCEGMVAAVLCVHRNALLSVYRFGKQKERLFAERNHQRDDIFISLTWEWSLFQFANSRTRN